MKIEGKKILITGGAGFIGSHLVDALAAERLCIVDDFSTGQHQNLAHHHDKTNVEIIHGDIRDDRVAHKVMKGVDIVFHLACRGVRHSIGNPRENHEVNALGSLVLLQAAQRSGVKRFVHVSSSEVYGTSRYAPMDENHPCFPETVYGAAKLAGEAYARAFHRTYGLPTVIVRPFNNFGPRSHFEGDCGEVIPRFAVWALNGKPPIIFGNGVQTRDFIYVVETAYWLCRVAECDALVGKTVNLGSGEETSVRELAKIVYEEAGRPDLQPEFREPRPGDVRRLLADARLARDGLGFKTRTGLREGIAKLLDHLRRQQTPVADLLTTIRDVNWSSVSTI